MAVQKKPHLCGLQRAIIVAHYQPARLRVFLHLGLADLDSKEPNTFEQNHH